MGEMAKVTEQRADMAVVAKIMERLLKQYKYDKMEREGITINLLMSQYCEMIYCK